MARAGPAYSFAASVLRIPPVMKQPQPDGRALMKLSAMGWRERPEVNGVGGRMGDWYLKTSGDEGKVRNRQKWGWRLGASWRKVNSRLCKHGVMEWAGSFPLGLCFHLSSAVEGLRVFRPSYFSLFFKCICTVVEYNTWHKNCQAIWIIGKPPSTPFIFTPLTMGKLPYV